MYEYYNPNPKGLLVNDCTVRAVSCLTGFSWEDSYAKLVVKGYELNDVPTSSMVFNSVMRDMGYLRHFVENTCPDCYTIADFISDHPTGKYVVSTESHVVTIIAGKLYDTWDSSQETVFYFWSERS